VKSLQPRHVISLKIQPHFCSTVPQCNPLNRQLHRAHWLSDKYRYPTPRSHEREEIRFSRTLLPCFFISCSGCIYYISILHCDTVFKFYWEPVTHAPIIFEFPRSYRVPSVMMKEHGFGKCISFRKVIPFRVSDDGQSPLILE
jgi:hypothetical protein